MIVGSPSIFAIESGITEAYSRPSFLALGYFNIIIRGQRFGVKDSEATMLACSFDEVNRRIADRGKHTHSFFDKLNKSDIVESFRGVFFEDNNEYVKLKYKIEKRIGEIYSKHIVWAPDGDAAFDDGSYVLHFDIGENVRIIAFRSGEDKIIYPKAIEELVLKSDTFYETLHEWSKKFKNEWENKPKIN